ncbi:MAG: Flp pilus assembly complex ATPase component TadA [Planctomycetes bacterium]|nr:Flp pilus assembly complex ATPase component TadA [Planctomycetota bacterium]
MPPVQKLIGQILVEMGVVDDRKVAEALEYLKRAKPGTKIGQAFVELGFCDESQVTKGLCKQYRLPFVDLSRTPKLPPAVADLVPRKIVQDFNVVPVKLQEGKLILAADDPMVTFVVDDLRFALNRELVVALTPPTALRAVKADTYGLGEKPEAPAAGPKGGKEKEQADPEAPVIRLVQDLMEKALTARASDIHIEPQSERVRVRYRVDGVCYEAASLDAEISGSVVTRVKVLAKMDIAEKRKPQDGRIQTEIFGRPIDMRVSSVPASRGESVVMRILDREMGLVDLDRLGFVGNDRDRFERIIRRPNGIFLVTGPTGSGKTTTLYAALKTLNKPNVKIITAENPVEYHLEGVNQCEVRHRIGLDFQRILRAMLRQAPNIILVGEIRDKETAEIAIQASLTGHLVFSTLHTNDAPSALTRLIDMGVKPFLVSTAVMAVLAQRLVRRLCLTCRQPMAPEPSLLRSVGLTEADLAGRTIYRAVGCRECRFEGYRGRVGVFELLEMDGRLREATFRGDSTMKLRDQARLSGGLKSLLEDGVRKVLEGVTTIEEILTVAKREDVAPAATTT